MAKSNVYSFSQEKQSIIDQKRLTIDGWQNILTNLGRDNKDKRTGMRIYQNYLPQQEIESIYQADDIAAKIIDRLPEDMTREGFVITGKDNENIMNLIEKDFDRLGLFDEIAQALKWSRLYGGAGIVMGINDGRKPWEPVDLNTVKGIKYMKTLHRFQLLPDGGSENIDKNLESKNFGKPVFYRLQGSQIEIGERNYSKIHHSRIIRFPGIQLGTDLMPYVDYWGDSILSRLFNVLRNFQGGHDSAAVIINDFTQLIVKLSNLSDIIASGDDNLIQSRLALMSATKSVVNAVVIQEGEEVESRTTSVAGLTDLLKSINDRLVAATEYPHTILLGEGAAGGLGTQGQSEKRDYYDHVKNKQKIVLEPRLKEIIDVLASVKGSPLQAHLEDYTIKFNPLWQPTQKEILESRKMQSEIDQINITNGILDPEEVTMSRYGGDDYSFETTINESLRRQLDDSDGQE